MFRTPSTALLEAFADCLESQSPADALTMLARVGGVASLWAERVRRALLPGASVASALAKARVIDGPELALLSVTDESGDVPALLRVTVRRRRVRAARWSRVLWGLAGPFGVGVLTVILDPIQNLIGDGSYFGPVLRGLFWLFSLTLLVVAGVPALLAGHRTRPVVLRAGALVRGLRWLSALYAEEELLVAFEPFAHEGEVARAGLLAAAALLTWSPLADRLRAPGQANASELVPSRFEQLYPLLTVPTRLAMVGGSASRQLASRLDARAAQISTLLTERLRLVVRVVAYGLVVLFSVSSLAGIISRGVPGMPKMPLGGTSAEQHDLDELMKQLEQQ